MLRSVLFILFLFIYQVVNANDTSDFDSPRIGTVGVLGVDRNNSASMGMGLGLYSETTELGVTSSGYIDSLKHETNVVSAVIYGGLRKALPAHTYFAYGVTFLQNFGRKEGLVIDREYEIGPYLSLEKMLTHHLMIGGWILPYQYDYNKVSGIAKKEHEIFSAGGITLNYFFESIFV